MTQAPDLRYTLIVRGVHEYILNYIPEGWEKNIIQYGRSEQYFGMIRSLTVPLAFVKDGAAILKNEFYDYGIKADVKLRLEVQQDDWSFKTIYEGHLDFTSNVAVKPFYFTISALSSDIDSNIKAYANATYEIPVNVPEAVTIRLTSIRLRETASFIFIPTSNGAGGNYFPGLQIATNEHKGTLDSSQEVPDTPQDDPPFNASDKWFFRANTDTILDVSGYIDVLLGANASDREVKDISIYNQRFEKVHTYYNSAVNPTKGRSKLDLKVLLPLVKDDMLFFYFDNSRTTNKSAFLLYEGELKLSYYTQSPETECKCLPAYYVFQQLMNRINGPKTPVRSYLLQTQWRQLLITCGDAIRQLNTKQITNPDDSTTVVDASPVLKTNLNDFFQSMNAVTCCGLGVENGVTALEGKSYFYRATTKAATFKHITISGGLTVNTSFHFNTIKGGYPDQTYDEINGRDEVNAEVKWNTPCASTNGEAKELNIQSVYRGDPYGIEYTRINLAGKTSIDSGSDNDIFLIYANVALTRPESSEQLSFFSGVTAGQTLYNWRISPKRNLLRHGAFLRSCFYKLEDYKIKFGTATKNKDLMTTDLSGFSVMESADILISSLEPPLFIPYNIDFKVAMDRDTLNFVDKSPNGYTEFHYNNNVFKAFLLDFSFDISRNSSQDFTGLFTPDNNLKLLFINN